MKLPSISNTDRISTYISSTNLMSNKNLPSNNKIRQTSIIQAANDHALNSNSTKGYSNNKNVSRSEKKNKKESIKICVNNETLELGSRALSSFIEKHNDNMNGIRQKKKWGNLPFNIVYNVHKIEPHCGDASEAEQKETDIWTYRKKVQDADCKSNLSGSNPIHII